jgi:hypothetical protein
LTNLGIDVHCEAVSIATLAVDEDGTLKIDIKIEESINF